jgi:hypothetical protein
LGSIIKAIASAAVSTAALQAGSATKMSRVPGAVSAALDTRMRTIHPRGSGAGSMAASMNIFAIDGATNAGCDK